MIGAQSAPSATVVVTVPRANVRAEPTTSAQVVGQVVAGTVLKLVAIEGTWFQVELPRDARLPDVTVRAYISNTVARLESMGTPAPAGGSRPAGPPPAAPAVPKPRASEMRDGMSVAVEAGGTTAWLLPHTARVVAVEQKIDDLGETAETMGETGFLPATESGSSPVTWVWTVPGRTAERAIDARRPSFVVLYKEIPGASPDGLTPLIVRLPAVAQARLVGAVRGRADQASRPQSDWEVMKDFRQEPERVRVDRLARGIARIRPSDDLAPGEYAVVLRLADRKKKLPGAAVLGGEGEAHAFGLAWDFSIK